MYDPPKKYLIRAVLSIAGASACKLFETERKQAENSECPIIPILGEHSETYMLFVL